MSFADDIRRFNVKVDKRAKALHDGVSDLAFSSIVEGSPVTGAPGQPVDTGNLKGSWQNIIEGPLTRFIVTNVIYAPIIEDGTRGGRTLTLRSRVGGWHSVKLTRAAWARMVEFVTQRITQGT
jgi:hypothetical protein